MAITEKQKAARIVNIEKAERAIAVMYDGAHVRAALDLVGLAPQTFYELVETVPNLNVAHAAARKFQAFAMVDDMKDLADGDGDPAKVRNQIEVRKWTASRLNRKEFGDSVEVNMNQTIDIAGALTAARERVTRPVSDQLEHDEAQTVEFTELPASRTHDK
jgi:hypothetical protein